MIETNNFLNYNAEEHFYYLTEAGMTEYTGHTELSTIWGKRTEITLIKMARELHNFITKSRYNGKPLRYRHKDLIEYAIFKNEQGEVQAIVDALVMMIELDWDIDWFRKLLNDEVSWPNSITNPLYNVLLYFRGELLGCVPEDEYQEGY